MTVCIVSVLVGNCQPQTRAAPPNRVHQVTSVKVSVHEWLGGMLRWSNEHQTSASQGSTTMLPLPHISCYSPKEEVLYEGDSDRSNADFLRQLSSQASPTEAANVKASVPNLQDYVTMFPELGQYRSRLLGGKYITVIAITNTDKQKTKLQDEAIRTFRASANVQVFEISLQY